jgi:hypothetical protein
LSIELTRRYEPAPTPRGTDRSATSQGVDVVLIPAKRREPARRQPQDTPAGVVSVRAELLSQQPSAVVELSSEAQAARSVQPEPQRPRTLPARAAEAAPDPQPTAAELLPLTAAERGVAAYAQQAALAQNWADPPQRSRIHVRA